MKPSCKNTFQISAYTQLLGEIQHHFEKKGEKIKDFKDFDKAVFDTGLSF